MDYRIKLSTIAGSILLTAAMDLLHGAVETVFPQFAAGPGIQTAITVHNPTESELNVKVELIRTQDLGGGTFFTTEVPLGARTTQLLEFRSEDLVAGWARLTSEASLSSTALLQFLSDDRLVGQVGILPGEPSRQFRIFGFRNPSDGTNTGVALVNPSPEQSAQIEAVQLDEAGTEIGRTVFYLDPGQHLARNINEPPYFEGTERYQGTIEFQTSSAVVPVTLRQDGLVTTSTPVIQSPVGPTEVTLSSPVFGVGGRTVGGPALCGTSPCDVLKLLTSPDEPFSRQGLDVCFTLRSTADHDCPTDLLIQRAPTSSPVSRRNSLGSTFQGSYCDADVNSISLVKTGSGSCRMSVEWRVDSVQSP